MTDTTTSQTPGYETIKTCPACGDPVVFTLEFKGYEFYCMGCGWLGDVFAPLRTPVTPELQEKYREYLEKYLQQRAERSGVPAPEPPDQNTERPKCSGCDKQAEGYLDHSGKPPHWYMRTINGVNEFACSRECIKTGTVAPW